MAIKKTVNQDALKNDALAIIVKALEDAGKVDIKQYRSNAFCYPVVDEEGNEGFIKIVVSIPKGSRDGEEWDGYEEAAAYERNLETKRLNAEKAAAEKAKKVEHDRKAREAKAKAKAEAKAKAKAKAEATE
jgi:hypothetical protein